MELSLRDSIILLLIAFFFLGMTVSTVLDNMRIKNKFQEVSDSPKIIRIDNDYYRIYTVNMSNESYVIDPAWKSEVYKLYRFSRENTNDLTNRTP